ncbi:MAG: S46 family peptidase [Bacteroidia bacterium]|nr:S46 family peptidase [Bacteroidia bacterium]
MNIRRVFHPVPLLTLVVLICGMLPARAQQNAAPPTRLDNGTMWTFEYPPLDHFSALYNFRPGQDWLDDVRLSALRFGNGCSASFISDQGLVMTNYHCGIDAVTGVTREGEDLLRDGFVALRLEDERKVEGLFVDQLVEIRDVTSQIQAAMEGKEGPDALRARNATITSVEQSLSKDGLRCQVVTLYHGGRYSAYLYKRYNDVRLVFSSERGFAFFGGVYDFWAYPRYSFDCDLFRVYGDDGKPLKTAHYFRWSPKGSQIGEPVFVVGNPGRTGRLVTASMLEFDRDMRVPFTYRLLTDRKHILEQWLQKNKDKHDAAYFDEIFGINNAQEIYGGRLAGLRDDVLMQRRRDFDAKFQADVKKNSTLAPRYTDLWENIAGLITAQRAVAPDLYALRPAGLGVSAHAERAAAIVRWITESEKEESERSSAFKGEGLQKMRSALTEAVQFDADIERLVLERQLALMRDMLGEKDDIIRSQFGSRSGERLATEMLESSILGDGAALETLLTGGSEALKRSQDPFLRLALAMQPRYDNAAARQRELAQALETQRERMGRALYDVYGTSYPPDATFSLRISDGVVQGYSYNGTVAPAYTTFYGMYDRYHSFKDSDGAFDAMMSGNAWDLPPRWKNPPPSFDLATPFNFVSTADIIGGNSGSPVINIRKEIVGCAFDGNIESLPGEFIFAEDKGNRTISVHSAGIFESLKHIYRMDRIIQELENARK